MSVRRVLVYDDVGAGRRSGTSSSVADGRRGASPQAEFEQHVDEIVDAGTRQIIAEVAERN